MSRFLLVLAAAVFATTAAAQTPSQAPALSETIVAKGNELCPKLADGKKQQNCEQVFGRLSVAATATEVRARLAGTSGASKQEIDEALDRTRSLYERAIETYAQ